MSDSASTPAPKKKHRFLKFVGAVIVIIVAIAIFAPGGDDSTTTTTDAGGSSGGDSAPGIGDEAVDGDFTFVVHSVKNGPDSIGDEFTSMQPQGKFVLVEMTVTNHGDSAGSFFGDNQYLIDAQGREASADTEAALYLPDSKSLYEEINPGNSVKGTVVFDIPADAKPAELRLHDSAFSGGVTVEVR
ncbi:uncharacterized protein DUF4352 [Haloactinopolyspora alba]|uniref:Uncharacterized protein DUF4352 n=1 Tax=Haloactinopolyspora alba TaxID=648780 RepID=A0A2P8D745_9ACTN|nr:DUF4352 domain-containing protein [Haloactinopolyspora alba]PSK93011.1 uncharacterized protein DUF4352 [Haloactinopolyspora alba]